jgi:hypothetical protein
MGQGVSGPGGRWEIPNFIGDRVKIPLAKFHRRGKRAHMEKEPVRLSPGKSEWAMEAFFKRNLSFL